MKDGYRLDGNYIKVAWATNKGINKDRRIKQYWNVEVGCTYIPWTELDSFEIESIDFLKWAEGGIVDEDSLADKYLTIYKKQLLQLANSDTVNSISTKTTNEQDNLKESESSNSKPQNKTENANNDMELDSDEPTNLMNQVNNLNNSITNNQNPSDQASMQHVSFQNLMSQTPNSILQMGLQAQQVANASQNLQALTQLNPMHQFSGGIQLPTILTNQIHPITALSAPNFSHLRSATVIAAHDSQNQTVDALKSQEQNQPPNQNILLSNQMLPLQQQTYVDLINSQRNILALRQNAFNPAAAQHFQFIQRPLLMARAAPSPLPPNQASILQMRNIILPLQTLQPGQMLAQNEEHMLNLNPQNSQQDPSTNEISSTTNANVSDEINESNQMHNDQISMENNNENGSNWNRNNNNNNKNNWRSNQIQRRSYQNDYSNRNFSPSNSKHHNNNNNYKNNHNNNFNNNNYNNRRSNNFSNRNSYNNRNNNNYESKRDSYSHRSHHQQHSEQKPNANGPTETNITTNQSQQQTAAVDSNTSESTKI